MSIRATITVSDERDRFHIYQHHDGYAGGPFGVVRRLSDARRRAWDLPRFEAADFAAAVVATLKDGGGSTYLTDDAAAHEDRAFSYRLHPIRDVVGARVGLIISQHGGRASEIFNGDLDEAVRRFDAGRADLRCDPELAQLDKVGTVLSRAVEEIVQLCGERPDPDTKDVLDQIAEISTDLADLQSHLDRAQPWMALGKAELVLSDFNEATRKGYVTEAKARIYEAMDQHRAYQRRRGGSPDAQSPL